ncbi:MAG: ATP-binding protein [Longimicrobiaceae bacterium]
MTSEELRGATILAVDDEQANLDLLEAILLDDGYSHFTATRDPRAAEALFNESAPDLVLLDLHMPHLDGFELLRRFGERIGGDEYLPIVVLTADITPEAKQRALAGGAHDFLTKPLDPVEVQLRIRNLLQTRWLQQAQRAARERAEFLAEASRVLATSFDYHSTFGTLAQLAVPFLADWCIVDVLEQDDTFRLAGMAHVDPARAAVIRAASPEEGSQAHPLAALFHAGETLLLEQVTDEDVDRYLAPDAQLRRLVALLRPTSVVVVPLRTGERLVGGITFGVSGPARRYSAAERGLAEELARRAALAVENARLFHQAELATRRRDDMLGVVAHDLRNPLNTIRLGTELLLETGADANQRKQLGIVTRAADQMNRLIEDLLDVRRIETGRLAVVPAPAALHPLLTETAELLRPLATAGSLALECDASDDLPRVLMDGARVQQVISNLVGNAVKFTPAGGRVAIEAVEADGVVRVMVRDTGQGIAKEELPHVFGQFWQAGRADRRGIGLGLAIAHGIIEAHGGQIWVESEPGQGSTFHFTLPVADRRGSEALAVAVSVDSL